MLSNLQFGISAFCIGEPSVPSDCESEGTGRAPVFAQTLVHYNILRSWSPLRIPTEILQ